MPNIDICLNSMRVLWLVDLCIRARLYWKWVFSRLIVNSDVEFSKIMYYFPCGKERVRKKKILKGKRPKYRVQS